MPTAYSNKQIEIANLLKGSSPELVDEAVSMIGEAEKAKLDEVSPDGETETNIKMKMMDEPDWRKRASLAAMLISRSLD